MTRTSVAIFEDFFVEHYKRVLYDIFEEYPSKRTIVIHYVLLEQFDVNLADLLLEKPEEVLNAACIALNNIDPLVKGAKINVRVEDVPNCIGLAELDSAHIGKLISLDGIIEEIKTPNYRIQTGVFECNGCMRLHEVEQFSSNRIIEPSLCTECGGRSFRLLQDESSWVDTQVLIIGNKDTSRKLSIIVEDDLCSHDHYNLGQHVRVTGVLKTFRDKKTKVFKDYLAVNNIVQLDQEITPYVEKETPKEYGDRNSPEYREWQKHIINRDKVCLCCGGDKHLQAHHIFGYENNPDLRVNEDNGIALCVFCHKRYHSYYGRDNATPKDLAEYLRRFGGR